MSVFLRWAADWRNGAVILGTVLVAYLGVLVVTSVENVSRALDASSAATASEREARTAAVRRIDQLLTEIKTLQTDARANGSRIATLTQEVELLEQQVRDLGGQPVITSSGGQEDTPQPRSSSHPTAQPTPTSTPTHQPPPSPSPTSSSLLCRLTAVCV